jgi:hypothetical protein
MSKRHLVIVHAGDASLHPQWLATGGSRNWDLVVAYHGDKPQRYPQSVAGALLVKAPGAKWPALSGVLRDLGEALRSYDYVWLPDDDLVAACDDINRMFDLMAALDLQLAQPSLSPDGQRSHPLALRNAAFAVRFTSFVDQAAAVFSRPLLEQVAPTFLQAAPARGCDWPKLLDNPARQCAILDCIQARRTGPGSDADSDASALQVVYGALDADGRLSSVFSEQGAEFVYRLCEGYLDCAAIGPESLGAIFTEHARIRQQFKSTATASAPKRQELVLKL